MGRVAKSQQQARAKARRRRIAMDHDRAARDERVEVAAAEAILGVSVRVPLPAYFVPTTLADRSCMRCVEVGGGGHAR